MALHIKVKDSQNLRFYPPFDNLPIRVARDENIFQEVGLEVEFIHQDKDWHSAPSGEKKLDDVHVFSRHYEFEKSESDIVNACEWGNLKRAYESTRGTKALSRTETPGNQAIIAAPGSRFTHVRYLSKQPVAVRFHSGSHYAALELLGGSVKAEDINLVNYTHLDGWNAVVSGEIAAVTLMEPWITLARKKGFQVLAEAISHGVELGASTVDPKAYEAYVHAIRIATERLNSNTRYYFEKYFSFIIAALPEEFRGDLTVDDFYLPKFRWGGPRPYPEEEFARAFDWMAERKLISLDASYDRIVNRELAAI